MPKVNISQKDMKKEFVLIKMDKKEQKIAKIISGDDADIMLRKFR